MQLLTLYRRDRAECWLCGMYVPWRFDGAARPLAPTRDHVIRLRDGGPNDSSNVRLAHSACNSRRESSRTDPADTDAFIARMLDSEPKRSAQVPAWSERARDKAATFAESALATDFKPKRKKNLNFGVSDGGKAPRGGVWRVAVHDGGLVLSIDRKPKRRKVRADVPRVDSERRTPIAA